MNELFAQALSSNRDELLDSWYALYVFGSLGALLHVCELKKPRHAFNSRGVAPGVGRDVKH
eukprot:13699480-Alexandrium_andersonii.AAC.1